MKYVAVALFAILVLAFTGPIIVSWGIEMSKKMKEAWRKRK